MEDCMAVLYENHQWKVTKYGIESLSPDCHYEVEAERLAEVTERDGATLYDWLLHMTEKTWVDSEACIAAFEKAMEIHAGRYTPALEREMLAASIRFVRFEAELDAKSGPHGAHTISAGKSLH
jgi:hypothetical protein